MVSWTCRRALLNWQTLCSGGVFRLRGTTAISQQVRAAEGLLGKMPSRSILEGAAVARCCHGAFSGARRWQNAREMRSSASDGGNILARCVPGCLSVASFALHASPRGPRTGKSPIRGKIRAPCIRNELALAGYARHASEMPRKQPFGNTPREDLAMRGPLSLYRPLESCTARESCHPLTLDLSATRRLR